MNLCRTLLGVFILIGVGMIFLLPPGVAPDEEYHWYTAGTNVPRMTHEENKCSVALSLPGYFEASRIVINQKEHIRSESFKKIESDLQPTCYKTNPISLSAVVYPSQLLLHLAWPLAASKPVKAIELFYLSRLLNLIIVAYALLRLIQVSSNKARIGTLALLGIFLSPIALQQSSVVSTDPMIFAFCLLSILFTLYLDKIHIADFVLLAVCGAAAVYPKPILLLVYLPAITLTLLRFTKYRLTPIKPYTRKQYAAIGMILFHATIAISGVLYFGERIKTSFRPGIDPNFVMSLITTPPFTGIGVMSHSISLFLNPFIYLEPLGSLDTSITNIAKDSYFSLTHIVLFGCILTLPHWWDRKSQPLLKGKMIVATAFLLAGVGLAYLSTLAMYLYWTPPEMAKTSLDGLQSRYFIPCFTMLIGGIFALADAPGVTATAPSKDRFYRKFETPTVILSFVFGSQFLIGICLSLLRRYW